MQNYFLFYFLIQMLSLQIPFTPVQAQDPSELEQLIRQSKTRASLVQNFQKAVVHIKVETILRNSKGQPLNNPYDLYNEEFFKRFFQGIKPPQSQPQQPFRQQGMGSGSIISKDGYILTNHHVVGEADRILVKLYDGKEINAKLVGTDPESDISVIKIDGNGYDFLSMGNSKELLVGESVIAVGNPFGLTQTVTYGIVSAKGRTNVGINEYENFIQTDAAINPGNSGGPLVNLRGEIIGVNSAIFTRSGGYQGIGFAVPINMARLVMEDLIEKGSVSRGWLGVGIQDINQDLAQAFKLDDTSGSLITGVMKNTPADVAGLKRGDVVIEINGEQIKNSNHLRNEIANAGAGSDIELIVIRDSGKRKFLIRLDERPKQLGRVDEIEEIEMGS
jgi:serine protease Do